jgi:hypothetical protein
MKQYINIFLSLFITIKEIEYPTHPKIRKEKNIDKEKLSDRFWYLHSWR